MNHADFVHLHNHSDFSLLDGASPIGGMVERAAELRMPALALTDHGSLFGAIDFYQAARKAGVKPIVGMEAYVTRGKRQDRTRDTAHHLVLLARDERGFRNLCRLSSLAFLEGFYYKPRVDHEILSRYSEGLMALSACPKGEIASDLLDDNEARALETSMMYRDLFGAGNFYLEIQNHGLEIEDRIRARVAELARRTGLPLVATNDCHYLKHEDADAHDVLLCIQTGKTVDDVQRMRYETDQVYFKSADEMKARFADYPEALLATVEIAEKCNLQLAFGKPLLPEFPLPPGESSPEDFLRRLAWEELRTRFRGEIGEAVRERFEYELGVICKMGFASYFLIVRDFIHYAKSRGIGVGPGRGSVAGSLVAYAMRITEVDPLRHGLIFERFLNPERVSMPDIDIDFDDLRRGEVIEYVRKKYGEDNVTQIITFGTMGAKGVLRDAGRALGIPFGDVDKIAKMVPDGLGMTLARALELSPDLKDVPRRGPVFDRLLRSAKTLEGLARHASTHAAGVLITPGPLLDYVPLYRQKDESVTTQWDMKAVEKAGLLKMDFLGLRTLSVLDEAVKLIDRHRGEKLDLLELPLDDAGAYEVFQRADTVAIFQFESSGMRDYLKKLKPTVFEDLTAMNALYRPGPMEHIPYFIDCKHGRQQVRFDHADLEPILKSTYGVFVYQEQVMQAANALAGFSMAQADELRRAMGKKKPEEMEAKRAQFVEGAKHNKIAPAKAEKVFGTMEKFAGYGFNKCLTGDAKIRNGDGGECVTMEALFGRRPRKFRVLALGEDGALRAQPVLDVVWNGRKPVFELRTADGRRITATGNHPFRTRTGWTELEHLKPGDEVAAVLRAEVESVKDRHEEGAKETGALATVPATTAIADTILWDRIVSIEPRGIQDTYDLTVEHDHNFVANGLIVHNSHSAAYALLAYQSAYLKSHYAAEFMAATLTSEMSDSARIVTLIEECRRMKVELLAPDVNRSEWKFTLEDGKIRFGLGAVRNVGQSAVDALVAARSAGGTFSDLFDLARRFDTARVNRRVLESLVAAGACDAFGERGSLFAGSAMVLDRAAMLQRERASGQSSLFGDGGGDSGGVAVVAPPLPNTPPWSSRERAAKEKEVLGFYFSDHPLAPIREEAEKLATHSVADALELEDGAEVRLVGVVGEIKPVLTRSGKRMAVVTLEDLSARMECTVFPDTLEAGQSILVTDEIISAAGRIEVSDRGTRLLLAEAMRYEDAKFAHRRSLHIEVRSQDLKKEWFAEVDEVLSSHPGDAEVYLHIVMPDGSRRASRSRRYQVEEGDKVVRALTERFRFLKAFWAKGAA